MKIIIILSVFEFNDEYKIGKCYYLFRVKYKSLSDELMINVLFL